MNNIGRKVKIINPHHSYIPGCNTGDMLNEIGTVVGGGSIELQVEFPNHGIKTVKCPKERDKSEAQWYDEPDMSLHINQLKDRKVALHCSTQEQWDKVLESADMKWCNNDKAIEGGQNLWSECQCISIDKQGLEYSPLRFYKREGYQIVEAEEFIKVNTSTQEHVSKEPVDDRWYVRCIKEQNRMKVDSEYEVIADEGEGYKGIMRYKVLIDDDEEWIYTENVTPKYQKHNTMNNKNESALQQIEAIKQQIADSQRQIVAIEESLKEPEWKIGDWIIWEENSYKNGPYQIASIEGVDGRDTNGNYRELSSGRYRHCTPEEIRVANQPKIGEKYIVIQNCSEKGTVVTVKELETKPGQYYTFQDVEKGNWWNIPDQVRKATPEEIKQYQADQVKILIGSDQREVVISKGKIVAADNEVKTEDIDRIAGIMEGTKDFGDWAVTFKEVTIGCCNNIQYSELKAIQEAYQKLNQ